MSYNWFSPTSGSLKGQQMEQNLAQAELEGKALREREALKRAAGRMGSQNYFAGFEGVPGAVRPDYLKELYASGDPDQAMKMEGYLAAPYALERDIRKAGEIERAKKEADFDVYNKMFTQWGGGGESAGNAFANKLGGEAPSAPPAMGGPTGEPDLGGLGDVETGMSITPMGPTMTAKRLSPFERELKTQELKIKRATQGVASDAEKRQSEQQAHENVRKSVDQISAVQKMMQNRELPWEEGQAQIAELKRQRDSFVAQRDALLGGAQAAPAPAPVAAARPTTLPSVVGPPPKLTEKEKAGLDVKDMELKVTAANKEVENARLGAQKVNKYKKQVKEIFDLVTTQDIGHPAMEGIPMAENLITMNRSNAQVKKLTEGIINMFAEPGQSQMMNTIVERQMQGAVVPSIFTDPQLNKKNAAILRSNVEHLSEFPTFLEKWKNSHDNALDGATEAWIDYTENNPLYTFKQDKRGRVTVNKTNNPISADQWMQMKGSGAVRRVGDKTFFKQRDGSWVEK